MKLLFDQNLSPSLVSDLADEFPGSTHVALVGLARALDLEVWEYARKYDFALVSKDADFAELSAIEDHPPRLVWLRMGNCRTREIVNALRVSLVSMEALSLDHEIRIVVIRAGSAEFW